MVLAYLSIGEAEDCRYYWKTAARKGRAGFVVLAQNPYSVLGE